MPYQVQSSTSASFITSSRGASTYDLRLWFLRKQNDWGFMVDGDTLDIFDTGVIEIRKNGIVVPFNKAQFRGILTVTDSDRFKTVFTSGIGRGKSFGFGLLQLHPISD